MVKVSIYREESKFGEFRTLNRAKTSGQAEKSPVEKKISTESGEEMRLEVSKAAADWYKSEMDLEDGDYVQYYVQLYGGIPTLHPNYSLGMSVGKDGEIAVKDIVGGITFYFNDDNVWFLNEYDMRVDVKDNDLDFKFTEK